MTDASPSHAPTHGKRKHDRSNYRQRLKAAGLDDDKVPNDIDEFRKQLARRITMSINRWHGCPEPLCQRHHGCMAPDIHCTNVPRPTAEEMEHDWPQVKAEIRKALKEQLAARGVGEG